MSAIDQDTAAALREENERLKEQWVERERYVAEHLRDADEQVQQYYRVMGLLRATKLKHGLCQPRERRACSHCNAVDDLEVLIAQYQGAPVVAMGNNAP